MRSSHGEVPRCLVRPLDPSLRDRLTVGRRPLELDDRAKVDGDRAGKSKVLPDAHVAGQGAVDDGRRHVGRLHQHREVDEVPLGAAIACGRHAAERARVLLQGHGRDAVADLKAEIICSAYNESFFPLRDHQSS